MSRLVIVLMTTLTVLIVCQAQSQEIADLQADISALRLHVNEVERIGQDGTYRAYGFPKIPFPKTEQITFSPGFDSTPAVVTGLTYYDNDGRFNDRMIIKVSNINRLGFKLDISTHAETKLYGVAIRWMACPKDV